MVELTDNPRPLTVVMVHHLGRGSFLLRTQRDYSMVRTLPCYGSTEDVLRKALNALRKPFERTTSLKGVVVCCHDFLRPWCIMVELRDKPSIAGTLAITTSEVAAYDENIHFVLHILRVAKH